MKNTQAVTPADIERCAEYDDLNDAVCELQDIAGIETGDRAGMWFATTDCDVWPIASYEARRDMLAAYIAHEAQYPND
ncbi:hypothetical protein [Burkholderia sp. LMG 21824]|uniref:hypothetical protein n=1 Tax=Burkholderia sp. LMG 21824 TaxID=3158172 RepID=UPI003C2B8A49